MSAPDSPPDRGVPDDAVEQIAAEWLVRRQHGLGPGERAELQAWLAEPRHEAAFTTLSAAWRMLNEPLATGQAAELACRLDARERHRTVRRRRLLGALGLAAAAMLAVVLWPARPRPSAPAHQPPATALPVTVTARPDRRTLPDGSTVELNAGAQIEVDFGPQRRRLRLLAGEAMFAVSQDPHRPFIVTAGGVEVRAVGTAFSVRHAAGEVGVLVTEGRVAVERAPSPQSSADPATPAAPVAYLRAGARLVVPADLPPATPLEISPVSSQEVAAALAWRDRRVEFSGTPLGEIVQLFNRQNRVQLEVSDVELSRHQLSGVFWSDDPAGLARLLATGLGVSIEHQDDRIVLRRR